MSIIEENYYNNTIFKHNRKKLKIPKGKYVSSLHLGFPVLSGSTMN
jgi:hypothetical protein